LSNGQSFSGTGTKITFSELNGTYSYTVETINKSYSPNPSSGAFTVNGANVNVAITFNKITNNTSNPSVTGGGSSVWNSSFIAFLTNKAFISIVLVIVFLIILAIMYKKTKKRRG